MSDPQILVERAAEAGRRWARAGIATRLSVLQDAGARLAEQRAELYDGLYADGLSHDLAEYYGGWIIHCGSPDLLARYAKELVRFQPHGTGGELFVRRPDGVVLLVTPANSPTINAATLFSILLPGNACIVRAPNNDKGLRFIADTIIADTMHWYGFSRDAVSVVTSRSRAFLGDLMPCDPVRTVVFFGNSTAGKSVAEKAQQLGKKVVLELEGSGCSVIWRDAALEPAVESARRAFDFSTQPRPIPKHFLVHDDVYDDFIERLLAEVPRCSATVEADAQHGNLVPVARPEGYFAALEEVAPLGDVRCGGYRMNADGEADPQGAYVAPTVVALDAEVLNRDLLCFDEEIFFPLIPVVRFSGEDPEIAAAMSDVVDRSPFGLRNSVWTESNDIIEHFAREIGDVGLLLFNDDHAQIPRTASPWGGPGRSGGAYGESHLFWEKTSHLQAIGCNTLSAGAFKAVLAGLGYENLGAAAAGCASKAAGLRIDDRVATIELKRPDRHNAVDPAMKDALIAITRELEAREDVACVVVRGSGPSFCSGADLEALSGLDRKAARAFMIETTWAFRMLQRLDVPVIAAVDGCCLGGGFELALHCDMIVAARDAVFGFPEPSLGLTTTAGSAARLRAAIGAMQANRLLLTGRRITGDEALQIGLVSELVDSADHLTAAVERLCTSIKASDPRGIGAMKRLIREDSQAAQAGAWIAEVEAFDELVAERKSE